LKSLKKFNSKISVIIPCFNHGLYINEAINSVINQSYSNWEIIVINDGSTDNETINILNSIVETEKIKILNTANSGLASARNIGVKYSSGEFILPLDADDKIGSEFLQKAIDIISNNSNIKIVFSFAEYFGKKSGLINLPDYSFDQMLRQNLIFCTALFRRTDFDKVNGYNVNMLYGWEDWDLWLSILNNGGEVKRIPEVLFYYRQHDVSMLSSIDKSIEKRQYLENKLIENHLNLYKSFFKEPLSLLRRHDELLKERDSFDRWVNEFKSSPEYRVGSLVLQPIRIFLKLFNKNL
jgi:glycosyltransferase involved in cell wall biosynthesis